MKRIMTYETLRYFAYSNDDILEGNPKGIVVDFKGLGNMEMIDGHSPRGNMFAEKGIIYIIPYNNPWNWMNTQAVCYTDEIIDILKEKYSLPEEVPVVAAGGSMGGLCALIYTVYARKTPKSCVVNCPVCDLPFHYTERPDLPRTLYSAMWNSGCDNIEAALAERSPVHQVKNMPRIDYSVFHCDADESVNIEKHSTRFVDAMKNEGHNISFHIVHGRGHCDLDDIAWGMYYNAINAAFD